MPQEPTKDIKAFRKALKSGKSLKDAKLAAGYSNHTAKMGVHHLARPFKSAWAREKKKYIDLALSHSADDQENIARGSLLTNVYEGKDRAVQSIKLLMQDKRVNMLTSDTQVGLIVIQPPAGMMNELTQRLSVPLLQGEVVTNTTDNVPPDDDTPSPL